MYILADNVVFDEIIEYQDLYRKKDVFLDHRFNILANRIYIV